MIARMTFINVSPENVESMKRIYHEEIVPVVKNQKGNLGAWLLEPENKKDEFISLTEWITKNDAEAYEKSGTYKALVDKVKSKFRGEPVLRTYHVAETKIMATA